MWNIIGALLTIGGIMAVAGSANDCDGACDANDNAPDPSVCKTCPAVPSAPGNLKVLFAAKVSGVVNLTLLPFECVRFSSLILSPL